MNRVAVLLLNWNGWPDTIECLDSLFRYLPADAHVIVCDNASTDGSVERIVAWAKGELEVWSPRSPLPGSPKLTITRPLAFQVYERSEAEQGNRPIDNARLTLIRTGGNLGFAGGNNVGLRHIMLFEEIGFIWLLNNDTVIAPGTIDALVSRMAERPDAGICGSTILHYGNPNQVQARGGAWYCKWIGLPWHLGQIGKSSQKVDVDRVEKWMTYVHGASMFVRRRFIESVGLMNEDYFLYFEELDWAVRNRSNDSFAYAPGSVVYHKIGQSIGTRSDPRKKSLISDFYTIRNRILFTRRHFPFALPTIYLSVLTAMVTRLFFGKWDHAWMIWGLLLGRKKSL